MLLVSVITATLATHGGPALIRFPCSQLVSERFDPSTSPWSQASISPLSRRARRAAEFVEDKSNYWTAVMYFRPRNGSYVRVPQMANHNTGPGCKTPGTDEGVTAFPPGFRMHVGYPKLRANTLDPQDVSSRAAPGYDTADLFWSGDIRSNIYFPHHVTHPAGAFFSARCPSSHPVQMPVLFMEIDGCQPFLFSMGDPTGFGQHAGYVFGWVGDSLQRAMDTCTGGDGIPTNCPELTVQDMDSRNA
ncbi:hypothetical protein DFP72DRAFT_990029 [Ephemerocybe angulata]|uniref:DUF1996 domain-containing protein n=1 Tax=Ephemerocybe angulata TaxID=980116 RepID=A0A8H6I162_9AGAR|nr:hypothetical protein DFP72DRAFT_990029 [Tulosesus angulatus]